jgi:hypothetical protein
VAINRRGALLLKVWPRWAFWQIGALFAFALAVVFWVWRLVLALSGGHPSLSFGQLFFWIVYFALFALPRPLRLYENGVWYTQVPDSIRSGFVTWEQLDRYRFEGDILVLTGTNSTLKGGPVPGCVLRLRADARLRVEPILAQHLSARL